MKDDKEQILKDLIEHEPVRGRQLRTVSPSVGQISQKMVSKYRIPSPRLLSKYQQFKKQSQRQPGPATSEVWLEGEKKIFIWILILYCQTHLTPFSKLSTEDWSSLSYLFHGKNPLLLQLTVRQIAPSPLRVSWTKRQEYLLHQQIKGGRLGQWSDISKAIFYNTQGRYFKNSKQCREHWFNYLDKDKVKGKWSKREDLILLQTYLENGKRWSSIAQALQHSRTEHNIKNRFYSLMKKLSQPHDHPDIDERQLAAELISQLRSSFHREHIQHSQSVVDQPASGSPSVKVEEEQSESPQLPLGNSFEAPMQVAMGECLFQQVQGNLSSNYNNRSVMQDNYQDFLYFQPPIDSVMWAQQLPNWTPSLIWPPPLLPCDPSRAINFQTLLNQSSHDDRQ